MIRRVEDEEPLIGEFIGKAFADYATQNGVELNYDDFCFVEEEDGKILGAITGRAYYNEVHVVDLIVDPSCRRSGLGSRLVATVEEAYKNKGYAKITLTTFGFQAPEFYKKLGYQIEFVRESKDPKLSKFFLSKAL
ncbi:MAG: GNAT family N-acetyltransferase [Clostridiales bacterium]|nr:GNAT family N-acetyltransferase [Clostridiales bacterium]